MPFDTTLRLFQVQSPYTEYCRQRAARLRTTFHVFLYDWRREIPESTEKLERYLEGVVAASGGRAVQLLCHSMGAIVALPLLAKRKDLIHSALFLAPGVRGSTIICCTQRRGCERTLLSLLRTLVAFVTS
jgi:pimeloyl-ACP methyl ester carboxylesterase